jgi:nicotinamidase-related amidase
MTTRPWDGLLTEDERQVWEAYTARRERRTLGKRPALLVIDATYAFVGLRPTSAREAVQDYPTACGETAWRAVGPIATLLAIARDVGVPVIYTTMLIDPWESRHEWATRASETGTQPASTEELERRRTENLIVKEIQPCPGEIVLPKRGASAFFQTPLESYLNDLDVDTVILTGGVTSGCIRGTAVDGACSRYYVGVVEDCVFDRFDISHRVALMDIQAKYGNIITSAEAAEYLRAPR